VCKIPHPPAPVKPSRSAVTRVDADRAVKGTGAEWFVTIWQGHKLSSYWLVPLASPLGVAYQFQCSRTGPAGELSMDAYDVLVENAQDGCCDCAGFLAWGRCKHLATLRVMIDQGLLGAR
jgi:hypothetical protein